MEPAVCRTDRAGGTADSNYRSDRDVSEVAGNRYLTVSAGEVAGWVRSEAAPCPDWSSG